MKKDNINIVLLKKDLRLQDNQVLYEAICSKDRTLLLYPIENNSNAGFNHSKRQIDFIKESLLNLNSILKLYDTKILIVQSEATKAISILQQFWNIKRIYFHKDYDAPFLTQQYRMLYRFCKNNLIQKIEIDPYKDLCFDKNNIEFNTYFNTNSIPFIPTKDSFITLQKVQDLEKFFSTVELTVNKNSFILKGGPSSAQNNLSNLSRLDKNQINIQELIYKLSPFISWGNISLRQVWQYLSEETDQIVSLEKFLHTIRWNIHYIQHNEFLKYSNKIDTYKNSNNNLLSQNAWEKGMTGYPIIDAIMRCLQKNGNINYKMRMLTVLFYKQYLLLPWSDAVEFLSKNLLDSSPGIQFNYFEKLNKNNAQNKRSILFNIIKHSKDLDPKGFFIRNHIPELRNIPNEFIYKPHKMIITIQKFHQTIIGKDYPKPIVRNIINDKIQLYNLENYLNLTKN